MRCNLKSALKVLRIYNRLTNELKQKGVKGTTNIVLQRKAALEDCVSNGTLTHTDLDQWFKFNKIST
mgnify:CR=1 FL=1